MTTTELDQFREEAKSWITANFPSSIKGAAMGLTPDADESTKTDFELWRTRLAEQGWGAPTWPRQYGGADLSHPQAKVVGQEMAKQGAFNPIPMLAGMGVTMVGPTILEWRRYRSIPYRVKLTAILLMAVTLSISIVFFVPWVELRVALSIFGVVLGVYLYNIPSRDRPGD